MIAERLPTKKRRIKFHADMFKDDSGAPDDSIFLERGLHINDLGLRALKEDPNGEKLFSRGQHNYLKLHFEVCPDCLGRFNKLLEVVPEPESTEEQGDLSF